MKTLHFICHINTSFISTESPMFRTITSRYDKNATRAQRLSWVSPSKDNLGSLYVSEREENNDLRKEVHSMFERILVVFKTHEIKFIFLIIIPLQKLYIIYCDMKKGKNCHVEVESLANYFKC